MIQMFQTCGMLELWLNPWVGQPPALLYSETARAFGWVSAPEPLGQAKIVLHARQTLLVA